VTVNVLAASGPRPTSQSRQRHSPRARRRARETGVDLDRAVEIGRPAALSCVVEADVTELVAAHAVLVTHVAAAAVAALRVHPQLNQDERVVRLGVRLDIRSVAPVVLADAGELNLAGLARRLGALSAVGGSATRVLKDGPPGATFTITDASGCGVLYATPRVLAGQTGHLVLGAPVERAAIVHGTDGERAIAIRSMAHLVLVYDAERVDDAAAVGFLRMVKDGLNRHDETRE
jgi:pyruvate dehydrogenase E2 component (dihydrolipoamide acetyltransferase)